MPYVRVNIKPCNEYWYLVQELKDYKELKDKYPVAMAEVIRYLEFLGDF